MVIAGNMVAVPGVFFTGDIVAGSDITKVPVPFDNTAS
jgi:hypothetical protein